MSDAPENADNPGVIAPPPLPELQSAGAAVDLSGVGDALPEGVKASREEVIPDCGHTPHDERPEELKRLLCSFLGEVEGGT